MNDEKQLPPAASDPSEDALQIVRELQEKIREIGREIRNVREQLLELTQPRE